MLLVPSVLHSVDVAGCNNDAVESDCNWLWMYPKEYAEITDSFKHYPCRLAPHPFLAILHLNDNVKLKAHICMKTQSCTSYFN